MNVPVPPTDTIIRLTELVLALNCFTFNSEFYKQVGGVCMGTRMGPSYACLFMGYLENHILDEFQATLPKLYIRYIDDILCAGNMTDQEVVSFTTFYNNFNSNIEVTVANGHPATFLDTSLTISNDRINSSMYYKETDSHAYLHYRSSHPIKCLNSIPYSQLLRVKRICSSEEDFHQQAKKVKSFFKDRGYPNKVIESAYSRTCNKDRPDLLKPQDVKSNTRIPLVLTYTKTNLPIVKTVCSNFKTLQTDPDLANLFPEPPLPSFRRDRSLKDILVRSLVSDNTDKQDVINGTFPCQRSRCKTCKHTSNNTLLVGPTGNFSVRQHFTCVDTKLVYAIHCTKCDDIYIGETERKLAERFREHLYLVNKQQVQKSTVAQHFNLPQHSYTDMEVLGLCHVTDNAYRKIVEKRLIKRIGTLIPLGLNTIGDH